MTGHAGLAAPPEEPVRWTMSSLAAPAAEGDALAGLSPLLRDVLPPLPGSPAVHRMQSDAKNSTTGQSGVVGRMRA